MSPQGYQMKTQKSTSEATAEAELASLSTGLKTTGIPRLDLRETILGRELILIVREDNEAAMKIVAKGYSPSVRYLWRTRRLSVSWLHEVLSSAWAKLEYWKSEAMRADPFTKFIKPSCWEHALGLIDMVRGVSKLLPL